MKRVSCGYHGHMSWTIYCVTHVASGRRYIGQTKLSAARRWKGHVSAASRGPRRTYFLAAIRKHGVDAFSHEVLEICETQADADAAERRWIAHHRTLDRTYGFNLMPGVVGERPSEIRSAWHRPEFRTRMSATGSAQHKALWRDPAYRASLTAKIVEGVTAMHAKDPGIRARGAANSKVTWAAMREKKTHVSCHKHGKVPLVDCYSHRRLGRIAWECRACAKGLAEQPTRKGTPEFGAVMSEVRREVSAKKRASRTHFSCKTHGDIALDDCYTSIRSRDGLTVYRCPTCFLVGQRARKLRKRTVRIAGIIDRVKAASGLTFDASMLATATFPVWRNTRTARP